jgi:putative PIN family toxin of toxin-antitoxin system
MNIVLDTNVLVSALLSPFQAPGRILDLILTGDVSIVFDDRVMGECRAVLLRPKFGFDRRNIEELLDECAGSGQFVTAPPVRLDLPDPADAMFVELAVAAHAPLVTGNPRHFPPDRCLDILILSPAAFLDTWQWSQRGEWQYSAYYVRRTHCVGDSIEFPDWPLEPRLPNAH